MAGKRKFKTGHSDPFVSRLEKIRQRIGCSQQQMADRLGVPFRTYQKWVYAGQKPRHGGAILARAEALGSARRVNCWEALKCGREPGGEKADAEGICPASTDGAADGVNSG